MKYINVAVKYFENSSQMVCPNIGLKVLIQNCNQVNVQFVELIHSLDCVNVRKELAASDVLQ